MRKLIAAINITLDGFCDHTAGIADDELHEHYNDLIRSGDTMIFGRVTYQLMESSWPAIVKKPLGIKAMDDFAVLIDNIDKVVFSRTLKSVTWKNTTLIADNLETEITRLKQQPGRDLLVGSPSLISQLTEAGLIDEYQLCIHPVILGSGLALFKNISKRNVLKLLKTKTFGSGAVVHYYENRHD